MKDNMGFVWWRILPIIYALAWLESWKPSALMEILLFSFIFIIPLIIQWMAPEDDPSDPSQKIILFLDSVIETGILLLVSLVPWVVGTRANDAALLKLTYSQSITFVLFFAWMLKSVINGKFELYKTPVNIPVILFFIWCIVSFFISSYKYAAIIELYHFAGYILIFFVVINNLRDSIKIRRILATLLITAGITAAYGISQAFGLDFIKWSSQQTVPSSLTCPYMFSDFLILTISAALGIFFSINGARKKTAFPFYIILLLGALYFTRVVCSVISLGIGMVFFAILKLILIKKTDPHKLRQGILTAVLIFLLIVALVDYSPARIKSYYKEGVGRIYRISQNFISDIFKIPGTVLGPVINKEKAAAVIPPHADFKAGTVSTIWHSAFKMFLGHPVFGVGIGSIRYVFPEYKPSNYRFKLLSHNTTYAGNELLQVLAETGFMGFGIFLSVFIIFFRSGIKHLFAAGQLRQNILLGCMTGVFACILNSLKWGCESLRYGLYSLLWLIMGLVIAIAGAPSETNASIQEPTSIPEGSTTETNGEKAESPKLSAIFFWLLCFALACTFLIKQTANYYFADIYLRNGNLRRDAQEEWDNSILIYRRAMKYEPTNIEIPYKLAYIYAQKKEWKEALKCYLGIERLAPNYCQIHYNFGITYYNLGDIDKATPEFAKTVKFDNSNDVAYFMLGVCYSVQKQWEKALEAFENAVESRKQCALIFEEGINPNYPAAHLNIGNIYYRLGRLAEARIQYETVLKMDPSNKDAALRLQWVKEGKRVDWE